MVVTGANADTVSTAGITVPTAMSTCSTASAPCQVPHGDALTRLARSTAHSFSPVPVFGVDPSLFGYGHAGGSIPLPSGIGLGPVINVGAMNPDTGAPGAEHAFATAEPLNVINVPEPSTWGMVLSGLVLLGWIARRRILR